MIDRFDFFKDSVNEAVVGILIAIATGLAGFFKKIPSKYLSKFREKRYLRGLEKASKINNQMNFLAEKSKGIYVHIVRYHNGGPQRVTVMWEELGTVCLTCTDHCSFQGSRKTVQKYNINKPLDNSWIRQVKQTINLKGDIHHVKMSDISIMSQKIWKASGIDSCKEIYLKTRHDGIYCLNICFCAAQRESRDMDALMFQSANSLRNLL